MADQPTPSSASSAPSQSPAAEPAAPAAASPQTPTSPATTTEPATPAAERPGYILEAEWDGTAGKVKDHKAVETRINEVFARDAAAQSAKLSLPQKAEDYKVELPASFTPPQGVKFEFDAKNPLWPQAQAWAHKYGISQEAFADGIALIAGDRIGTQTKINEARNAEFSKLGATATARVDAVTSFFMATVGETEGKQLASRMFTASDIQIAEKLIARFASQGSASFRQNGRVPDQTERISQEAYDKLSYSERKEYAAKFPQQNGAAA